MQYYQETVFANRRIDRAHEYSSVAKWHKAFTRGTATFEDHPLGFRQEPDTGWPPPAHEHEAIPPQRALDPLMTALRPPAPKKKAASGEAGTLDPARRLFAQPLPTYLFF